MKHNSKRMAAFALAAAMCMPMSAMAAPQEGSFDTSFDIYSPALHIDVPLSLNIEVNPFKATGGGVDSFEVASGDINIINASVDETKDIGIPVNATVTATLTNAEGVQTEFTTFTADPKSTKKKIYLELTEVATPSTASVKNGGAAAFEGTTKLLDLSQYEVAKGDYTSAANMAPITSYGSLLSVDIAKPALASGKSSYIADPADVIPTVGTFAVTGVANTHADWKADDVKVAVTYKITASDALAIKTPVVANKTGVTNADITFDIPQTDMGESTVAGIAFHDPEGRYADYLCTEDEYTAVKDDTAAKTTVTLKKDGAGLAFVTGDDSGCKGSRQDLVVALSDGRRIVVSLELAK